MKINKDILETRDNGMFGIEQCPTINSMKNQYKHDKTFGYKIRCEINGHGFMLYVQDVSNKCSVDKSMILWKNILRNKGWR